MQKVVKLLIRACESKPYAVHALKQWTLNDNNHPKKLRFDTWNPHEINMETKYIYWIGL